jgi:integrase
MARLVKPLTATQVQNAKPKEAMYKLFDGGGLFLQVNPTGSKHWKLKYRRADGKEGLLSFGAYPDVTLEQARKRRDEARAHKAAGLDPGEIKRREKLERAEHAKNTFEAVARTWLEVHASKVAPITIAGYRSLLENNVFSQIGKMPIRSLKAPDFLQVLRRIEAQDCLPSTKITRITCSMVMRFAVASGQADFDPLPSLVGSLKTRKPKHLAAITDPKEVGRLLRTIWGYPCSFVVSCALKIAPYVFVRPGELRAAKWANIDFDACEWRYTVTKTGTPHIVPLAPQVMEILNALRSFTGDGEYVFPSYRNKKMSISQSTMLGAIRGMGFSTDEMTTHGFRAIARTLLDEVLEERYDFIEQQLAHVVRDPNGRAYNRTVHLAGRKRMMNRWGVYLDNLRDGIDEIPPYEPVAQEADSAV